ncbi:uncharacterized protein (DUF1697 family) [Paenibacillus cellulosilyticus]|uniref:Uncharacterized protein (DUF1697 family) n=1 Tax=Paenibacillus cellulosilyticus TaxID=375489 RepID=A0A2V2YXM5_9BACL|nr:DUF1697 domain-containing protein [Paenibacillus cellulosilyticus]PWW05050.1 uncharacterized protein (DUF1697 family) [Paenibacillus cellulosilyticus]QKS48607.1 DUF1697 domain-containing protein [Paenibacillus cellulosilyticus]
MVFVALLRGINVGGNNKVDMKKLKRTFEGIGLTDVVTYINTGNIIFRDDTHSAHELSEKLEEAIAADFGLKIKVMVRTLDEIKVIMDKLPEHWTNGTDMKSDVLYLWEEINDESVLEKLIIKPEVDRVIYVHGAILWSYDRDNAGKSGMNKIIGTKVYQQTTVRNVNTARKIYELMLVAEQKELS